MKSVLVVDDEKSVRDSIRMILEYEKFEVQEAGDAPSATARVEGGDFDLVLLDIKMPGEDGLKVLRRLRQGYPDLPVVMISGHGTIETAVEATRLGAYDFLPKPLDRDKLLIVARNAAELGSGDAKTAQATGVKAADDGLLGNLADIGGFPRRKYVFGLIAVIGGWRCGGNSCVLNIHGRLHSAS